MIVETKSVLIGLIGAGIDASLSPAMHEREGDQQGIRYMYKRIDLTRLSLGPEALPDLLVAAERMGFAGLNITHPCKQLVIPYLDEMSDEAAAIGAVNTVLFSGGKRIGYNTDGRAFVDSFRRELGDVRHECVVLAGAGGAGTAIAHSLLEALHISLIVLDQDLEKARSLVTRMNHAHGPGRTEVLVDLDSAVARADGFINATPVGMDHFPGSALPQSLMRKDLWIADIVYFPLETELLKTARSHGCRTMDGGGMAVQQAVAAFKIFTSIEANAKRMSQHFRELVAAVSPAQHGVRTAAD